MNENVLETHLPLPEKKILVGPLIPTTVVCNIKTIREFFRSLYTILVA